MLQKVPDDGCIKIFEPECRRRLPESTADISTQELECIAVTGDGVLADAFFGFFTDLSTAVEDVSDEKDRIKSFSGVSEVDGWMSGWMTGPLAQTNPFARNRKFPVGCPERSRARVLCAAKRTLDGEDSRRTMEDERTGCPGSREAPLPYGSWGIP